MPKQTDVEGQCNAHLHIADDQGDNDALFRCYLPSGHDSKHSQEYVSFSAGWVKVEWEKNQRPQCCEGYFYERRK